MKTEQVIDHISGWLKDYCIKNHQKGFVVGVSGGIDSAVTSALCARTGLPTLCVEMPIHQAASHVTRALEHVADLRTRHDNVSLERVDLTPTFDTMELALPDSADDAAHRHLVDVEGGGEADLRDALIAKDFGQRPPLRQSEAMRACLLLEAAAHQARHFVDQVADGIFAGGILLHGSSYVHL